MPPKPKRTGNYKGGKPGRTRKNPRPPTKTLFRRLDKTLLETALADPDFDNKLIAFLHTFKQPVNMKPRIEVKDTTGKITVWFDEEDKKVEIETKNGELVINAPYTKFNVQPVYANEIRIVFREE